MRAITFQTVIILTVTLFPITALSQQPQSSFYLGVNVNVATIFTNTSYKSLFDLRGGYNYQANTFFGVGPQVQVNFVKSPFKKGATPSIYFGASTQMETGRLLEKSVNPINHTRISNKLTWVLPINPSVNNYEYKDCISFTTSIKNSGFSFYRTSLDLNIDFQRLDLGFVSGLSRIITFSSGASNSFIK